MKHKHAELIHAWADGAQSQLRWKVDNANWEDCDPAWTDLCEYRIKPEDKPDIVKRFYLESNALVGHRWSEVYTDSDLLNKHSLIKCTFDGETKKLKAVEVI